jgi:hypothetical protein
MLRLHDILCELKSDKKRCVSTIDAIGRNPRYFFHSPTISTLRTGFVSFTIGYADAFNFQQIYVGTTTISKYAILETGERFLEKSGRKRIKYNKIDIIFKQN